MANATQRLSFRSYLNLGPFEEEKGFRELLGTLAKQGMFVYGLLGIVIIISFVFLHIFPGNKTPVWNYSLIIDPDNYITLPDKSLILLFCILLVCLSRTSISLNWRRILIFLMSWIISMSILMDDILLQDVSFSQTYITIVLIVAIGAIPYTGWQAGMLTLSIVISILIAVLWIPNLLNVPNLRLNMSQIIYLFLIVFLLTGMSSQIYITRYRQYLARFEAEKLSKKLNDRARTLEMMKEKSEKQALQLLENEKLKNRFFANVSHEFRTPLTLIIGPLKDLLLNNEEENEKVIKMKTLTFMYKNSLRLLEYINQLLDLSKVDAGEVQLNLQSVNLNELLSEIVANFAPMAEARNIDLIFSTTKKPVVVQIDPRQMEKVIDNLISNAIKFTPEAGTVTVDISKKSPLSNTIDMSVKDTGIGIDKENIHHIFDRFYQITKPGERFNQGTGIGLAFAKEIIELHKGNILVKSKPLEGSEFIVQLYETLETPSEKIYTLQKHSYEPSDLVFLEEDEKFTDKSLDSAPSILLIDDNPDILTYLSSYLSKRYNVILEESSNKALEVIKDLKIDLIISDVMMPHPDGIELCRIIKRNESLNHIPVILLTAQAAEEIRIEGLEHGADDYITKPFSASELLARVENLIEIRRLLREKFSQQVHLKGREIEVSSEDARFLKRVQLTIEKHMENNNFGVDWLADEINLSSRQLQRKIRAITDLSAGGYIRMMRLEHASQLLSQRWGNVSEISYKVGFQDTKYFSQLFKQTFGMTPTEFIENQD